MASIATDLRVASLGRAAFVGGFLLGLVVWLQCLPPPQPPSCAIVSLAPVKRPPVIVPMELYREPEAGLIKRLADALSESLHPGVIVPPDHPDAQPWPRGMVIYPPPFPDRMAADIPTSLDRALSALLAPWLTTAS